MLTLLMSVSFAAAAPVPKTDEADKALRAKVDAARPKMVKFLKDSVGKDGTWEGGALVETAAFKGGTTALVVLALLDAGVPANDPALEKALPYLAELKPEKTYVVSLATQALARADAKKYAKEIQANTDWLMEKALTKNQKLIGWSYPIQGSNGDGSNTHFALAALHAAQTAGAKVDAKLWGRVRDLYAREQTRNGGWCYVMEGQTTTSMTACGALALVLAAKHDKPADPDPALAKALALIVNGKLDDGKHAGYLLFTHAELGRALGSAEFKHEKQTRAWYREGAERILKLQVDGGSVTFNKDFGSTAVLDTAFALFALGPPTK